MRIYDLVYQSAPILGSVSTTTTIAFSRDCQVQILPFLQLKGGDFYHSPCWVENNQEKWEQ